MATEKYLVRIGTPARKASAYVEAASADEAVKVAVEKLAGEHDREWLEKYAANRDRRTGTCYVEKIRQ